MLVDGHSVAFRAYYALPESVRDGAGLPANALYGFMNILFRVLQDHRPSHLAVTFDLGAPFREDFFPGYKAGRAMGPEDLEPQVAKVRTLLTAFSIPIHEVERFEADDLLATLVRQALQHRFDVDVLSGDLDVLQLVGPGVRVVAPGKTFSEPVVYDAARVSERYGVSPGQLRDWKALVGDSSDAIPGVRGIGPKSATELLRTHGDLDAIYAQLDTLEPVRARNALAAGREAAFLCRRLVTLRDDAPITLDLEASRLAHYDRERAIGAIRDMGFGTLATRVPEF